jgi:hypothetical protein
MIFVRDIFYLKFGKAKEAKALIKEAVAMLKSIDVSLDVKEVRIFTDLTGRSYRLILVTAYANLANWEQSVQTVLSNDDWRKWYEKFIPLVDTAEREILSEVN